MMRPRRAHAALAVTAVLLLSCVEPELLDEQTPTELPPPDTATEVPVDESNLRAELGVLQAQLAATMELLNNAADAVELTDAHALGAQARALLVGDAPGDDTAPPVLPSQTPDRAATADQPGMLISVLTEARSSGSALASEVITVLSDDLAGDLGAWQRDPEGMIAFAADVATSTTVIGELESAILALPGEGTRALAWIEVVLAAGDLELATGAASRASTHVRLVLDAVDELAATSGPQSPAGTS